MNLCNVMFIAHPLAQGCSRESPFTCSLAIMALVPRLAVEDRVLLEGKAVPAKGGWSGAFVHDPLVPHLDVLWEISDLVKAPLQNFGYALPIIMVKHNVLLQI